MLPRLPPEGSAPSSTSQQTSSRQSQQRLSADEAEDADEEDLAEDNGEEFERRLVFDGQVWQQSDLQTKAKLLGKHLKLGAENTLRKTSRKVKKNFQKLAQSGLSLQDESSPISLLDRHFAAGSAIRDFNETMPVVLPSNFEAKKGLVIRSDPEARLLELEEEEERRRKLRLLQQQQQHQQSQKQRSGSLDKPNSTTNNSNSKSTGSLKGSSGRTSARNSFTIEEEED